GRESPEPVRIVPVVTEGRVEPEFDPGDPPHELPVKAGVEKGIVDRELWDILLGDRRGAEDESAAAKGAKLLQGREGVGHVVEDARAEHDVDLAQPPGKGRIVDVALHEGDAQDST